MPSASNSSSVWPICRLFGLDIQATTLHDATAHLTAVAMADVRPARVVVTPNVDHLVRLDAQPAFKALYTQSDYIFADGMPVVWASRRLSDRPLPERVTGADLFVALARSAAAAGLSILVIGGLPGQEAELQQAFARVYPGLRAEVFAPSMQFDPGGAEGEEALRRVALLRPAMVFVCLGMPKQERWALSHRDRIAAPLVLCVGAAMEFALGFKHRAPLWMQRSGLEWFWRLASEPRRLWRRYLVQSTRFARLLWRERAARRAANHIHQP
ncbi:MAG: WecB/TagA/CpsF family glycosyltransferase [Pseudomonadota bacterium]